MAAVDATLDSGEAEGLLYYVMPWVAGGSLRRLLTGDHEIPLEAVLRILREVASALDHLKREALLFKVLGSYPEAVL